MKLADFNALCEREHAKDGGIVDQVSMSPEGCAELTADVLADPLCTFVTMPERSADAPPADAAAVVVGARVAFLANPAVPGCPVQVRVFRSDDFDVPARARVLRWVDC